MVVTTELHIVKSKGNVALINRGLCIFLAILKSNSNYRKKNFEKILSSSSRDFTVVEGQTLFGWQISAYLRQVCAFSCYLMPFDEHKHILQLSKENYFEKCVTFLLKKFISQFYIPGKSLASAKNGLKMYLLDLNL